MRVSSFSHPPHPHTHPDTITSLHPNLYCLLGQCSVTFFNPESYSTGSSSYPVSVAAADINGDGTSDIVVANANNADIYSISILLNTGNGEYGTPTVYSTGFGNTPSYMIVPDVLMVTTCPILLSQHQQWDV